MNPQFLFKFLKYFYCFELKISYDCVSSLIPLYSLNLWLYAQLSIISENC